MKSYNSYNTKIKTYYSLVLEEELLPTEFIASIPRSRSQGWKDLHPDSFVGEEFADRVEADLEQVKLILDERLKRMKTMLYLTIIGFIDPKNFEKLISQNKEPLLI